MVILLHNLKIQNKFKKLILHIQIKNVSKDLLLYLELLGEAIHYDRYYNR